MSTLRMTPQEAWLTHILPRASDPGWFEKSRPISKELPLSRRELLGLIVAAYLYGGDEAPWLVGYDPMQSEPNDGFISDGDRAIRFEHKIVSMRDKREVLSAILGTYTKYAARGTAYGQGRTLIIHPNKPSDHGGLIRISDLRREIGDQCPFDRVFTLVAISQTNTQILMHLVQHFPWPPSEGAERGGGIAEVAVDTSTGNGEVRHRGMKF